MDMEHVGQLPLDTPPTLGEPASELGIKAPPASDHSAITRAIGQSLALWGAVGALGYLLMR